MECTASALPHCGHGGKGCPVVTVPLCGLRPCLRKTQTLLTDDPGHASETWQEAAEDLQLRLDQPRDRLGGLLDLGLGLRAALLNRLRDAVTEVILQQAYRYRLQGPGGRRDLRQHIDAVGVVFHHPLQAPDLALDPAQPPHIGVFVLCVPVHVPTVHERSRASDPPARR